MVDMIRVNVTDNVASAAGGGLAMRSLCLPGLVSISGGRVTGNVAEIGAGVAVWSSRLDLQGTVVASNVASEGGGGGLS